MSDAQKNIPVMATKTGFYGGSRKVAGTAFNIKSGEDFSENWMKPADPDWKPSAKAAADEQKAADEQAMLDAAAKVEQEKVALEDERDDLKQSVEDLQKQLEEANKALEEATKPEEPKSAGKKASEK